MRWPLTVVLAVICWHAVTVKANFGGNWSALWYTGSERQVPPEWEASTYRFPNSYGYDGQLYRLVAHDPFFQKGYSHFVDDPALRYRRILVPLAAHILGLGNPLWIDRAYYLLILFFTGLGTFWLSRWLEADDWRGWLGMTFVLAPATFVSIDRLTVDVALAALVVGFAVTMEREQKPTWKVWIIVALAGLVRETGLLLTAGCVVWLIVEKRLKSAVWFAAAALPAALWYLFVSRHTSPLAYPASYIPFREMLDQLMHPVSYGPDVPFMRLVQAADTLAILGMIAAAVMAARWIRTGWKDPVKVTGLLFALLCVLLQRDVHFQHVYDFGRVYTPLVLLLAMDSVRDMRFSGVAPLLMLTPRLLMTTGTQVLGIARAIGL